MMLGANNQALPGLATGKAERLVTDGAKSQIFPVSIALAVGALTAPLEIGIGDEPAFTGLNQKAILCRDEFTSVCKIPGFLGFQDLGAGLDDMKRAPCLALRLMEILSPDEIGAHRTEN